MSYDREAAKKQLQKRQEESAARASSSGFVGVLKDNLPVWKAGEGKHKIDILPFVVGKKHPNLKKGEYDYKLDVWLHSNVGIDNAQYICLRKMFGDDHPCPICDYRAQLQQDGEDDKDVLKKLQPKLNTLYNIVCYDSTEQEKKGVQLWLINTFNMEDRLQEIADADSGERVYYPSAEAGKRIAFKRTGTGPTNTRYTAHSFLDRGYKISEKLLDKTYSLDECIIIPTESEVEKAFLGGIKKSKNKDSDSDNMPANTIPSEDEIEEMTRKELKNLISDLSLDIDPDDDDYEDKEDLRKAVLKEVKGLKKSKKKDEDDEDDVPPSKDKDIPEKDDIEEMSRKELKVVIKDFDLDIDPDDDDYEDKEDLCKAVLKELGLSKKKDKKKDDDDDDDDDDKKSKKKDDDDDDDGKKKDIKCPVKKGTFGEDFDKFPECIEECKYFDDCSDAYDAIKKDKKAKKLNRR